MVILCYWQTNTIMRYSIIHEHKIWPCKLATCMIQILYNGLWNGWCNWYASLGVCRESVCGIKHLCNARTPPSDSALYLYLSPYLTHWHVVLKYNCLVVFHTILSIQWCYWSNIIHWCTFLKVVLICDLLVYIATTHFSNLVLWNWSLRWCYFHCH